MSKDKITTVKTGGAMGDENRLITDCAKEAAAVKDLLNRINNKDQAIETNTGNKLVSVKTLSGKEYEFSRRIGQALIILKKATGYYKLNNTATEAVNVAVEDCAAQWGITESTVWDKITRQFGITVDAARKLYTDALTSEEHRFDDLLVYLTSCVTDKDSVEEIRQFYLGIFSE